MTTIVREDLDNQFVWASIEDTYDEDGVLVSSIVLNDDGSEESITYIGGVASVSVLIDGAQDANDWDRIETSFTETGDVASRLTVFDDTTTMTESYLNGVRFFMQQTDPLDNFLWNNVDVYFDLNGKFDRRVQFNDDGTTVETEFIDGLRIKMVQQDLSDPLAGDFGAKSWDRIESYFDEAGVIESKIQQNDDRTTITTDYLGGIQSKKVYQDFSDPFNMQGGQTGAQNWDRAEVSYDAAGIIEHRLQINDDGSTLEVFYVDGIKTRMTLNDEPASGNPDDLGVKSWDQIDIYYENGSEISQKFVTNDDGTTSDTTYVNGIISHTVQRDLSEDGDARDWVQIDTYYDVAGTIDYRVTNYDDGRLKTEVFENGILDSVVIDDVQDAEDWSQKTFLYDIDGALLGQGSLYDDGDWVYNEFVSGTQVARHDYDGDDSLPWVGKTIHYDADGRFRTSISTGPKRSCRQSSAAT